MLDLGGFRFLFCCKLLLDETNTYTVYNIIILWWDCSAVVIVIKKICFEFS